jgi:hypothetical protein
MRPSQEDVIPPEQKIKYFPAAINIGGFLINTNPTGAIEVKPQAAAPEQAPAFVAKPVSIAQDISGVYLFDSAETGGRLAFTQLLNSLLDVPGIISLGDLEPMSVRSALGRLFSNFSGLAANVADISGVRLAAEEAKSALNDITDAMQDVSGALLELRTATLGSDLSGVLVRVAALESAPGFDPAGVNAVIADLSGNLAYYKTTNDAAVASAQSAADSASTAAAAAQSSADAAASAASLAQSTADTKVAQSDYNAFVIATNSSLDSKALASDLVSGLAAKADASALDAKEDKGLAHSLVVEEISTAGISGAYWAETIGATIATALDAAKLVSYIFDGPAAEIVLPAGSPAAGALRRLKNGHASAELPVSLGGVSYVLVAGEIMSFVFDGSAWKMV